MMGDELFYCISEYLKSREIIVKSDKLKFSIEKHIEKYSLYDGDVYNNIRNITADVLMDVGLSSNIDIVEDFVLLDTPVIFCGNHGIGIINDIKENNYILKIKNKNFILNKNQSNRFLKLKTTESIYNNKNKHFRHLLYRQLRSCKRVLLESVIASFLINLLALFVSLFSMQIYDRVIPTGNIPTLTILTTGIGLVVLFELAMKFARSKVMDGMISHLDYRLSSSIFEQLLAIRIDKLPRSVGSMVARLRSYEQIRVFFSSSALFVLVDVPMSAIFIVIIAKIGSWAIALIPIIATIVGILLGLFAQYHVSKIAASGASDSYKKTGLLVEAIDGIETIKANKGYYYFLRRWNFLIDKTIDNDIAMRHGSDYLSYGVQSLQQISYVCMVVAGSMAVIDGNITMGALIASTILGGRILSPIMALPNFIMQYSHAKTSINILDDLFDLPTDNGGTRIPLSPSSVKGDYDFYDIAFTYLDNDSSAIAIDKLRIKAGEKIAILGGIGSGKSTLLKLLAGIYHPTKGRILLDGLDMQQINTDSLSDSIGYLQQDHRLFEGTLRQNLLIGLLPPSDDELNRVLMHTGLQNLVLSHAKGLELPISEGGQGVSGGQKQLIAFTRIVLNNPNVWVLDEPTSSMDNLQEARCLSVLDEYCNNPAKTLIIATHKIPLLKLVDRVIILANQRIIADGPKDVILNRLMGGVRK